MSQDSAHALAETTLARLLKAANRRDAGVGQRAALTGSALAEYRALRSLQDKEAFDAVLEREVQILTASAPA